MDPLLNAKLRICIQKTNTLTSAIFWFPNSVCFSSLIIRVEVQTHQTKHKTHKTICCFVISNASFVFRFSLQLNDRHERKTRNGASPGGISDTQREKEKRMSLLGKPLNYKANRRDVKYRKLQAKLYNFLERPTGRTAAIYHGLV